MSFLGSLFGRNSEAHLKRADSYIASGHWGEARIELMKALKMAEDSDDPRKAEVEQKFAKVTLQLARSHEEEGDHLSASELPDEASGRYQLALSLFEGEEDRERVKGKLSRERPPSSPPPMERLFVDEHYCPSGECAPSQGEASFDGDPLDYFDVLVNTLEPDLAESYRSLGENFALAYVYTNLEDFPKAMEHYDRAMKEHPSDAILYKEMGRALLFQGETERSIEAFGQAWLGEAGDIELGYLFSSALMEQGELDRALQILSGVIEHSPDEIEAYLMMGDLYKKKEDMAKAKDTYLRALQIDPEFPATHSRLGSWAVDAGDVPLAIEHYGDAVEYGERVHDLVALADLYLQDDRDPDAALGLLNKALYLDPENRWIYLLRISEIYLKKGWNEEGQEILMRLRESVPSDQGDILQRVENLLGQGS
jgi:tetratricopeptide (TPR) repeat protein